MVLITRDIDDTASLRLETLMNFPFFFPFSFSKLVAPCIDQTIRSLLGNRCCSQRAVKVSSMKEISHGFEVIS